MTLRCGVDGGLGRRPPCEDVVARNVAKFELKPDAAGRRGLRGMPIVG